VVAGLELGEEVSAYETCRSEAVLLSSLWCFVCLPYE
jgi:hypothetical protein